MNPSDFQEHNAICPLPWNGVFVGPNGAVQNCAISKTVLGNINQQPIQNFLNNEINQEIRRDMLNNQRHKRCSSCYQVEDNSPHKQDNESNRSWYKKIAIKSEDLSIFDSTTNFSPTILDLRWRNTCNYACVYCLPGLSNTWESLVTSNTRTDEQNLEKSKQYIFDNLKLVKHVYLAGGEPLLMKDNQELLERLYQLDPSIEIRINSNISNLDTPVYAILKKFKNVRWTISVESTGSIFEYMRWPGNWSTFLQNAHEIQHVWGDQINFNMVWCVLNFDEIFNTFDCLIDQGFHENMFIVQCLTDPKPLNVLHLPATHIQQLKLEIERRQQAANPSWWLYKSLTSMYNFLDKTPPDNKNWLIEDIRPGLAGTLDFLSEIDRIRKTNQRKEVFKTLYQIYDSHS